jgi:hypothetical protein
MVKVITNANGDILLGWVICRHFLYVVDHIIDFFWYIVIRHIRIELHSVFVRPVKVIV